MRTTRRHFLRNLIGGFAALTLAAKVRIQPDEPMPELPKAPTDTMTIGGFTFDISDTEISFPNTLTFGDLDRVHRSFRRDLAQR